MGPTNAEYCTALLNYSHRFIRVDYCSGLDFQDACHAGFVFSLSLSKPLWQSLSPLSPLFLFSLSSLSHSLTHLSWARFLCLCLVSLRSSPSLSRHAHTAPFLHLCLSFSLSVSFSLSLSLSLSRHALLREYSRLFKGVCYVKLPVGQNNYLFRQATSPCMPFEK